MVFASELSLRFGTRTPQQVSWSLHRNCALSPGQFGFVYLALCTVSLGIALAFWSQGVPLVAPFAVLELSAVGIAFLMYARHATDAERIVLDGTQLTVDVEHGGRLARTTFRREWVQVQPPAAFNALIEVASNGRVVRIGRHVRPELRSAVAREIRQTLAALNATPRSVQVEAAG